MFEDILYILDDEISTGAFTVLIGIITVLLAVFQAPIALVYIGIGIILLRLTLAFIASIIKTYLGL